MKKNVLSLFFSIFILYNVVLGQESVDLATSVKGSIIYRTVLCANIKSKMNDEKAKTIIEGIEQDVTSQKYKILTFCKKPIPFSSFDEIPPNTLEVIQAMESLSNELNAACGESFQIRGLGLGGALPIPENKAGFVFPTEAQLLNGLTDFLIERAKDEIMFSFVNGIDKKIEGDSVLLKILARTLSFLKNADKTDYRSFLPSLRAAVLEDYNALPNTLLNLPFASKEGKHIHLFSFIVQRILEIKEGTDPAFVLSKLNEYKPNEADMKDGEFSNIVHGFRTVGMFARELYVSRNITFDGDTPNLMETIQKPDAAGLFFALLLKDLNMQIDMPLVEIEIIKDHQLEVIQAIKQLNNLYDVAKKLEEAQTDSARITLTIQYVESVVKSIYPINTLLWGKDSPKVKKIVNFIDRIVEIQKGLIAKEYSKVVVDVVELISSNAPEIKLSPNVIRLMTFGSNLASARSEEDVQKALEASADPVGSFIAKREGKTHVTINSYVGLAGGGEQFTASEVTDKATMHFGAIAPVGIEWTLGTYNCFLSSMGLFLSPIDLGTLVNYRLSSDSVKVDTMMQATSQNPNTSFAQVFSPAAYLVFGITKEYPITLGFGYQYVPRLRNENIGEGNVSRWSLFLAIDLTLLRF